MAGHAPPPDSGASPTPTHAGCEHGSQGCRAQAAASQKPVRGNGAVSHAAEWNHWFGKGAAHEGLCLEDLYFKQATANIGGEQIHYQQVISKQLITVSLPTRS